ALAERRMRLSRGMTGAAAGRRVGEAELCVALLARDGLVSAGEGAGAVPVIELGRLPGCDGVTGVAGRLRASVRFAMARGARNRLSGGQVRALGMAIDAAELGVTAVRRHLVLGEGAEVLRPTDRHVT